MGLFFKPKRLFKIIENGYVIAFGSGEDGDEITAEEYADLQAAMDARPTPPDGYDYRLTAALEWEQFALPPAPDPETQPVDDPAEALALLLGGGANG